MTRPAPDFTNTNYKRRQQHRGYGLRRGALFLRTILVPAAVAWFSGCFQPAMAPASTPMCVPFVFVAPTRSVSGAAAAAGQCDSGGPALTGLLWAQIEIQQPGQTLFAKILTTPGAHWFGYVRATGGGWWTSSVRFVRSGGERDRAAWGCWGAWEDIWAHSVDCPADLTGDALVSALDVGAFAAALARGDLAADFNYDGLVNALDTGLLAAAQVDSVQVVVPTPVGP